MKTEDLTLTEETYTREGEQTPYRIDIVQPVYFVLESFEQLAASLDQDIPALIAKARAMGDLPARFDEAA